MVYARIKMVRKWCHVLGYCKIGCIGKMLTSSYSICSVLPLKLFHLIQQSHLFQDRQRGCPKMEEPSLLYISLMVTCLSSFVQQVFSVYWLSHMYLCGHGTNML